MTTVLRCASAGLELESTASMTLPRLSTDEEGTAADESEKEPRRGRNGDEPPNGERGTLGPALEACGDRA